MGLNKIRIFFLSLLAFLCLGFYYSEDLAYGLLQARGQLMVLGDAREVSELLEDPKISLDMKKGLRQVGEIKGFANDKLRMEAEGLYETMYDQNGKDILWNLSACKPFDIEEKVWTFPIVGEVSYKGFFDLAKARLEEAQLKEQGYDARIRPVSAWSTLGWFDDPILSKTLDRDPGSFAELLIHEITHTHIFYRDSIRFNENLASFIGEQGAILFLKDKYGSESQELMSYLAKQGDDRLFTNHCLNGLAGLKLLYNGFDDEMSVDYKSLEKSAYMKAWVGELHAIEFSDSLRYKEAFKDDLPNNAFFMAFARYDSKKSLFADQLKMEFSGDLRQFIDAHRDD